MKWCLDDATISATMWFKHKRSCLCISSAYRQNEILCGFVNIERTDRAFQKEPHWNEEVMFFMWTHHEPISTPAINFLIPPFRHHIHQGLSLGLFFCKVSITHLCISPEMKIVSSLICKKYCTFNNWFVLIFASLWGLAVGTYTNEIICLQGCRKRELENITNESYKYSLSC